MTLKSNSLKMVACSHWMMMALPCQQFELDQVLIKLISKKKNGEVAANKNDNMFFYAVKM